MPKRITYLEARGDRSREAFRSHWSTTHADIARGLPGVTAYRQNHVLEPALPGQAGGRYRVDGIVELWFAADDVVGAGFRSDVADRLAVDEQHFLSGLTGGPVAADAAQAPWPWKLWVLARWHAGAEPAPAAVERWARHLSGTNDDALGWGMNVLVPGAELLVREALRHEEHIPEVAVSFGFADPAAARMAAEALGGHLSDAAWDDPQADIHNILTRIHVCVAEEIVII
ncbi:EthD family reductase [Arthrobacter sp. NQ4]|uniref:EthD family reductase n=1 Tax=Arthrobacter sp. NQ4 TaxID=3027930 RepID=UPI0023AFD2AC|nr:EthD family reductase [Arthrobacter sp. NQ4]MDE8586067.1 EthD family reductase [Arthrobacter sp. NQ4]